MNFCDAFPYLKISTLLSLNEGEVRMTSVNQNFPDLCCSKKEKGSHIDKQE